MKKVKKIGTLLLAAVWLLILLSPAALADADTNTYTVVLQYNDNVQLRYLHSEGIDEWWTTTGDVPLGGARLNGDLVIPQLYCVDAQVPFHSYVDDMGGSTTYPGGRTTDTVPDYVAVSPNEMPLVLHGHWNELSWLVMNGYSDDYNDNSDNDSLADLNTSYPTLSDTIGSLTPITKDVAVMATKAAVWHYTNPDVAFVSTNFLDRSNGNPNSANGIKHRQFVALMKALVADADAYAANPNIPLYGPSLEINIDNSVATTDIMTDPGFTFYGPYSITSNVPGTEKAFLETTAPGSSGIGFYSAPGTGITNIISGDLQRYGEESSDRGPGVDIGEDFYIKAPNSVSLDNVNITAFTRATVSGVPMPIVLVHQEADGEQDWEAIQAFIGLTTNGNATAYASAVLPIDSGSSVSGTITVRKTPGAGPGPFYFRLTDSHGKPVDLGGTNINPLQMPNGSGEDGIFVLSDVDNSAAIGLLPVGDYVVTELRNGDTSTASYNINGGPEINSRVMQDPIQVNDINGVILPITIAYTNHAPAPSITLQKQGGASGTQNLANAVFRLTKDGGSGYDYDSGNINTNINGEIAFPALPAYPKTEGIYTLTEVTAPTNHNALSGPVAIDVADNGTVIELTPVAGVTAIGAGTASLAITVVDVYNPPSPGPDSPGGEEPNIPKTPDTPSITLQKQGGASGTQNLANAVFRLTKNGGGYDSGEISTNVNGKIAFPALPAYPNTEGIYTLTEVSAPANHNKLSGPVAIEVAGDGTVSGYTPSAGDAGRVDETGTETAFVIRIVDVYNPPSPDTPVIPDTPTDTPNIPDTPSTPDTPNTPDGNTPDTPGGGIPDENTLGTLDISRDGQQGATNRDMPQTGGGADLTLWIALLGLAVSCAAGAFFWRAKWRRAGKW
jgi:TQXA domain-containing protein